MTNKVLQAFIVIIALLAGFHGMLSLLIAYLYVSIYTRKKGKDMFTFGVTARLFAVTMIPATFIVLAIIDFAILRTKK